MNALKLNMATFTVFKTKDLGSGEAVVSYFMSLVLLGLPFFYAYVLHKNKAVLSVDKTIESFGALYENLNISTNEKKEKISRKVYVYVSVFLLRRTLFIFVTIWLMKYPT